MHIKEKIFLPPLQQKKSILKKIINFFYSNNFRQDKKIIRILGVKFTISRNISNSFLLSKAIYREILNTQFQLFEMKNKAIHFEESRKKLNNFLLFKYYYTGTYPNASVNLGDYVQTYCTQQAIRQVFNDANFSFYDRDSLAEYSGEQVLCVMQGWFAHQALFLPNNNILPVFVGTHIAPSAKINLIDFLTHNPNYFHNIEVGCRDRKTQKLFADLGIKSYFSRCLTLTLPKREDKPSQNKVFIVNIQSSYFKHIPHKLLENAVFVNQRSVDLQENFQSCINHSKDFFDCSVELLERYKNEARLVITSAIHCAMPCLAMGIPVILIDFEKNNSRFDVVEDIIKIYTAKEFKSHKVDFNPTVPNIENLKKDILRNLYLSTEKARGNLVNEKELEAIRERINHFK